MFMHLSMLAPGWGVGGGGADPGELDIFHERQSQIPHPQATTEYQFPTPGETFFYQSKIPTQGKTFSVSIQKLTTI